MSSVRNTQKEVADDPPHEIDRETAFIRDLADEMERFAHFLRHPLLDQSLNGPDGTGRRLVKLGDLRKPLLMERAQEVGPGDRPRKLPLPVDHGNEALVLLDHDPLHLGHGHVRIGDRPAGGHELLHVLLAQAVEEGLLHDLARDDALVGVSAQDRQHVHAEPGHGFARILDRAARGNGLDRRGHKLAGHGARLDMTPQYVDETLSRLEVGHVPDHRRRGRGVPAPAQFLHHESCVHLGDPAPCDHMGLVGDLDHKEEHVQTLHVPDLMRQVGEVRHEVRDRQGRDHHAHSVDVVAFRGFDEAAEDRDLFGRQLPGNEIGDDIEHGALLQEVCRGLDVAHGRRDEGEGARFLVDAQGEDRRLDRADRDPPFLQELYHDRGRCADLFYDFLFPADVSRRRRMMVVDVHRDAGPLQGRG